MAVKPADYDLAMSALFNVPVIMVGWEDAVVLLAFLGFHRASFLLV